MPTWERLLNSQRRKQISRKEVEAKAGAESTKSKEPRTEAERDYDRVLFSTPLRRLADKTQVFPLDRNDSVRTRLTHSYEVSNLARSIGVALAFNHNLAGVVENSKRDLPSMLAAIGLIHDLGNPPFGHQGEAAIQNWFSQNSKVLDCLTPQMREDFQKFEGNAQAFRLVTKLQLLNDGFGLDLTYGTLAAMMKYPTPSHQTDKSKIATKKHGFFYSEQSIVEDVLKQCGLELGKRHPLAHIMEACDDIAYVVLDAEDAVKKGLASFSDLMAWLEHKAIENNSEDEFILNVVKESRKKHDEYRNELLSPAELNDISMQRFRVFTIGMMVTEVTNFVIENEGRLINGEVERPVLDLTKAKNLRDALQEFSLKHAYTHQSVLSVELTGFNVINGLMDMFWAAITDRSNKDKSDSKRNHPFTRLVYTKISENYRRVFSEEYGTKNDLPLRYKECQLLTDMVSGMTDTYAVNLYYELKELQGDFDLKRFLE